MDLRGYENVGVTKDYAFWVYFKPGLSVLDPELLPFLKEESVSFDEVLHGLLLRWEGLSNHIIRIIGYADEERENEEVAKSRAEVVHDFLLRKGISPNRFEAVSWRLERPIKEKYRNQNRKALVVAYNPKVVRDDWRYYFLQLHGIQETLPIGCPESEVIKALGEGMISVAKPALELGPGDLLLHRAIPHQFEASRSACLCALLTTDRTLKDLWLAEPSVGILPLKRAMYDGRLARVKPGMGTDALYSLLGKKAPMASYKGYGGKRVLDFRYYGFGRDMWDFEVEAENGIVARVHQWC